jgi:predicted TIM-barrel fold metal-dependent hydrolase
MTKDAESAEMEFPVEYMFKEVPNHLPEGADPVEVTLREMDRCGVAIGMVGASGEVAARALRDHPDRFVASLEVDPNDITGAVRAIRRAKEELDIKAVTSFPAGCNPQVPVSDRRYYPIFQTCIDLDLPIMFNAGVPGPRVPGACQDVMHFDQVCYDFPELRIVMRHGAEPWEDLAVKLIPTTRTWKATPTRSTSTAPGSTSSVLASGRRSSAGTPPPVSRGWETRCDAREAEGAIRHERARRDRDRRDARHRSGAGRGLRVGRRQSGGRQSQG